MFIIIIIIINRENGSNKLLIGVIIGVPVVVTVNNTSPEATVGLDDPTSNQDTDNVKFTVSFYSIQEITPSKGIFFNHSNCVIIFDVARIYC